MKDCGTTWSCGVTDVTPTKNAWIVLQCRATKRLQLHFFCYTCASDISPGYQYLIRFDDNWMHGGCFVGPCSVSC